MKRLDCAFRNNFIDEVHRAWKSLHNESCVMTYCEVWASRTWSSSASVDSSISDASKGSTAPSNPGSQKVARYRVLIFDESEAREINSKASEEPIVWLLLCKVVAKAPTDEVASSLDALEKSEVLGTQD